MYLFKYAQKESTIDRQGHWSLDFSSQIPWMGVVKKRRGRKDFYHDQIHIA
jgi:hypothetical protein